MTKKLNGMTKWIIVGLALLTVVFNSGVTYNHVKHLSEDVKKLEAKIDVMDGKVDAMSLDLVRLYP